MVTRSIRCLNISMALALIIGACADPSSPSNVGPEASVGDAEDAASTGDAPADNVDTTPHDAPSSLDDGATSTDTSPDSTGVGCLPVSVSSLPRAGLAGFEAVFSRYATVFGVHLVATQGVPEAKLKHAAGVMAQYLDNDEDGSPDDVAVVHAMTEVNAIMVMFATENELEQSGLFESDLLDLFAGQDLYATETHPGGSSASVGFDATLEEVLHLITSKGHARAYPDAFGEHPGTTLTDAMDLARGGRFMSVPPTYPPGAWYHYDDVTCDYECMATEYVYWALTSILGAQSYAGRCEDIAIEWEPCTEALVQERDPAVYSLLTNQGYALPTALPDGMYCQ